MLVVIVVAAATAFSFFVSAYEKQVLSEENQQHDRALEKGTVSSIQICSPSSCPYLYCLDGKTPGGDTCTGQYLPTLAIEANEIAINVSFVSDDVDPMFFTGYLVNSQPPQAWLFYPHSGSPKWMTELAGEPTWSACQPTQVINGSNVSANASCSDLPPYQQVNITLLFSNQVSLPISLNIDTSLADEFSYAFTPPVAIIKTTILPQGNYFEPLFDGSGSYQPSGGDNASLAAFEWSFVDENDTSLKLVGGSGPEIEVAALSSENATTAGNKFVVTLNVTNTDGLEGSTSVYYQS